MAPTLIPRYRDDPPPGAPFPLAARLGSPPVPEESLLAEAAALRGRLSRS